MGVQEIVNAIPTSASGGSPDGDALRTELVQGIVGFIDGSTSIVGGILQVDPVDAGLGGVRQAYVYGPDAGVFVYDSADETTAQDGIFCIVLIGGKRYKRVGLPNVASVVSRSFTSPPDPDSSPPGSRNLGDAYLVLSGAAWASEGISGNQIAVWSSLGGGSWQGIDAAYGPPLYIQDEDGYVHWAGDDGWVDGVGSGVYADASIPPSAFIWDNRVENQTTNSPPSTWLKGVAYIIGSSPTGDWAGNAAKIALALTDGVLANGDTFDIRTQFDGQQVYDKAQGQYVTWSAAATAWIKSVSGYANVATASATASASLAAPPGNALGYDFSASTPPTSTANATVISETLTATVQADYAGQSIEVDYIASLTSALSIALGSGGSFTRVIVTAAVYVDSETNAREWQAMFNMTQALANSVDVTQARAMRPRLSMAQLTLADTSAHTIKIRFHVWTDGANNIISSSFNVGRRSLRVRKLS